MKTLSMATLVCLFASQSAFAGDIAKGKKLLKNVPAAIALTMVEKIKVDQIYMIF